METEAMRIAKEWADSTGNMGFICRAFLAQQARLAEVQEGAEEEMRQRDHYRAMWQAAESRLASARVEAFVAGWERFAELARDCGLIPRCKPPSMVPHVTTIDGIYPDAEARKKYPAPAAPAGEQTRPAPTPEPERWVDVPIMADVTHSDAWRVASDLRLRFTPEDCRRIVALGSRPTQTAEGK